MPGTNFLLPIAFRNNTKPLYTEYTAGGGGGSNYPANAVFSTITTGTAVVSTIQSGSVPLLIDGQGNPITVAASALNIPGAPTNISTLNVSSINGSQYPPGQSDVFSTITVSSINGAQYPPSLSDTFSTLSVSSIIGPSGQISLNPDGPDSVRIQNLGAPGDITLVTSGGGAINLNANTTVGGTLQTSNLISTGNTLFALNTVAVGTTSASNVAGTIVQGPQGTFSNATVSSINGLPYPYPAPLQFQQYAVVFSTPSQNISGANALKLQSTVQTTWNFNDFWTYTGPLTAQLQFNGTGNTNNFTGSNGSNFADFNRAIVYTPQGGVPIDIIVTQSIQQGALTGSFGPSTSNQNLNSYINGFEGIHGTFDIKNPPPGPPSGGAYYTGPGVEANITLYGPGSVVLQDNVDFALSSGDPGATYEFIWLAPVNSNSTNFSYANITWR